MSCEAFRGLFWTARGEIAVQLRDDRRPLADGPANLLDRARTGIAHGEHAGDIRFERQWAARAPRCFAGLGLRTRWDKSLLVELDTASPQPVGRRIGANEQEYIADRPICFLPAWRVAPAHPLQPTFRCAGERDDFGLAQKLDIRPRFDAVDEIARHRRSKAVGAHEHGYFGGKA